MKPKPRIPLWRWALWWLFLFLGIVVFYVLLTPFWVGLRAAAWTAELRARRRQRSRAGSEVSDPGSTR
jgi:hypothetical protein